MVHSPGWASRYGWKYTPLRDVAIGLMGARGGKPCAASPCVHHDPTATNATIHICRHAVARDNVHLEDMRKGTRCLRSERMKGYFRDIDHQAPARQQPWR